MALAFARLLLEATRKLSNVFKILKENHFEPKILGPAKLSIKYILKGIFKLAKSQHFFPLHGPNQYWRETAQKRGKGNSLWW